MTYPFIEIVNLPNKHDVNFHSTSMIVVDKNKIYPESIDQKRIIDNNRKEINCQIEILCNNFHNQQEILSSASC